MSISCACDFGGDYDWYYYPNDELVPLNTKRGRRCASCSVIIKPKNLCIAMQRFRSPTSFIEENIHGDEVPLTPYYHCEECAKLQEFITKMGWCFNLGDNLEEELNLKADEDQNELLEM